MFSISFGNITIDINGKRSFFLKLSDFSNCGNLFSRQENYFAIPSSFFLMFNAKYEPRQANLCLRAFRHDKF